MTRTSPNKTRWSRSRWSSKATGISTCTIARPDRELTRTSPQWGFLGAQYIDVLQLNEALAALKKEAA